LSYFIEDSKDEGKLTMIQPHLLTRLIKNFGEEIKGNKKFLTPGTPRFKIQRSKINMDVLDTQFQKIQIWSRDVTEVDKIFSTRH
jgi:hypothetical protein